MRCAPIGSSCSRVLVVASAIVMKPPDRPACSPEKESSKTKEVAGSPPPRAQAFRKTSGSGWRRRRCPASLPECLRAAHSGRCVRHRSGRGADKVRKEFGAQFDVGEVGFGLRRAQHSWRQRPTWQRPTQQRRPRPRRQRSRQSPGLWLAPRQSSRLRLAPRQRGRQPAGRRAPDPCGLALPVSSPDAPSSYGLGELVYVFVHVLGRAPARGHICGEGTGLSVAGRRGVEQRGAVTRLRPARASHRGKRRHTADVLPRVSDAACAGATRLQIIVQCGGMLMMR